VRRCDSLGIRWSNKTGPQVSARWKEKGASIIDCQSEMQSREHLLPPGGVERPCVQEILVPINDGRVEKKRPALIRRQIEPDLLGVVIG